MANGNLSMFAPTRDLTRDISLLMGEDEPTGRPLLQQQMSGCFLHVSGISVDPPEHGQGRTHRFQSLAEHVLGGLYAGCQPFIYCLLGEPSEAAILLSVPMCDIGYLEGLVRGHVRSMTADAVPHELVCRALEDLPHCAVIVGIPSPNKDRGMETLIRGLFGCRWAYVVSAHPVAPDVVAATQEDLAAELRRVKNTYLRDGTVEQHNNPMPQYYHELLQAALGKYNNARVQGCWIVRSILLAESEDVMAHGTALLGSMFSGEKSLPSPFRVHRCHPHPTQLGPHTTLNTPDLSLLLQLPSEEVPGFRVSPAVSFATALPARIPISPIAVGQVLQGGMPTPDWLTIPLEGFTKHALVAGVTGGGKTETCHFLLDQLWREHGIPYLVVEPAKSEYRDLRYADGHHMLRVFTLGDESEAPFRINPFEFPRRLNPQTHIDYLRTLFNASFAGLYPPMPYLIEAALYQVYINRGWDLTRPNGREAPYPRLVDFCSAVEEIAQSAGYDRETTQNISTALRVRLNSLRMGSRGLMLGGDASIPFKQLMTVPTVLEMGSIADPELVAFMMGLILMRIYEALVVEGHGQPLRHVTLVEEAHRLLATGLQSSGNPDVTHIRGQAVESFCTMLAEMRAYGEGLLIVDQSPTKLHPDIVKGTNLKIVHRVVSEDDRKCVAGSSNMSTEQCAHLSTMETGEAAVYAEGFPQPFLVRVPQFRRYAVHRGRGAADIDLRTHMTRVFYADNPGVLGPTGDN